MSRFLERLADGPPIVADGGMGALLASAVPRLRCPEEANLRAPESVVDVHLGYIRAGAELIETNTFGANRSKLAQHFLEDEFDSINSAGVRLAREAREVSGRDVFIAGSIGPDPGRNYAEQALLLEGRGADLFMVETFLDLDDLEAAVAAIRSVSSLPIVGLMSFDAEGETLTGVSAGIAGERLRALGLAAFGANHGAGPSAALRALGDMAGEGGTLAALPNVGLASMSGQRIVFPHATPAYFGEFAAQARALGAGIIGGCCGTTPAQIAAIRAAVDDNLAPTAPLLVRDRAQATRPSTTSGCTELGRLLDEGTFVVSVQLDPPLGANPEALIETARAVRDTNKAQFVDVNDNPRARARMSGIMASVAIERFTGVETIPHLTPRDMTVTGLESILLGAHAEGVRNILAVTGDPPEAGDYPGRGGVYEVDAIGLVELLAGLNRGEDSPRPRHRRTDVVLPGRCRQPDRGRPRPRGGALPSQGRGGRALRHDAVPLRPRAAVRVSGSDRRTGRSRSSSASGRSERWSCSSACTTRFRARSSPSRCRSATAGPARTRAKSAGRSATS